MGDNFGITLYENNWPFADLTDRDCRFLWMLVEGLFDRVGEHLVPSKIPNSRKGDLTSSIYFETLRLRVASTVGHTSLDDQLCHSGGWKVKAGVPIMFTGWLAGRDESCWNTDQDLPSGNPEHHLNPFWAERFLDCPGSSSMSGPTKNKRVQPARESPKKPTIHSGTEDARSKASVAGLRGHFFPFGSRSFRCPSEALAKHVIFASVAMALQSYDLRLIDPDEARNMQPSHRELPFVSIVLTGLFWLTFASFLRYSKLCHMHLVYLNLGSLLLDGAKHKDGCMESDGLARSHAVMRASFTASIFEVKFGGELPHEPFSSCLQ